MLDTPSVAGIAFHTINICILCPLIIYFLHQFKEIRYEKICRYRTVWLCQLNNFIVLFGLVFERSYCLITRVWIVDVVQLPSWIGFLVLSIAWWAAMGLFAIKVYHLHYEQQCNVSIAKMSMANVSLPDVTKSDWYIQNRHRHGNPRWTIRLALFPYAVLVLLGSLSPHLAEDERLVLFVVNSALTLFPIGVSLCMLWHSGKLRDIYGIRDEISIQCFGFIIAFIVFLIPGAYFTFFTGDSSTEEQKRLEWLFCVPQTQITSITVAIVSSAYPVYRYKRTSAAEKIAKHMQDLNRQEFPSTTETQVNTPRPSNSRIPTTSTLSNAKALKWVIADSETYKQFMEYLISEFSTENLLFLTELVQIKYHFQMKNNWLIRIPKNSIINTPLHLYNPLTPRSKHLEEPKMTFDDAPSDHNDDEKYMTIDFHFDKEREDACWTYLYQLIDGSKLSQKLAIPLSIPTTTLITEHDDLFGQFRSLYDKYIPEDSPYQINIAYALRYGLTSFYEDLDGRLKRWMDNDEDYKLFNLFDEPCLEILRLMQQSMYRFRDRNSECLDLPRMQSEHEHDIPDAALGDPESPRMRNASSYHALQDKYRTMNGHYDEKETMRKPPIVHHQ